jgi:dinuclear metal center YbgI/SA1388 family protein
MITLQALCDYLDNLLQISSYNDYCINGIQLEGVKDVSHVVTAVSASLETIQKAADAQADVLLVHHGLFWNKDPHSILGTKRNKLKLLLEKGISVVAYHLPLDAHQEFGNNWKAAKDLGWKNLQPFYFEKGLPLGVKGEVNMPREEFQKSLEKYYGHPAYTALGGKSHIKTAGLISGGAHKIVFDAAQEGLDAYVTGSHDEPVWHTAHEEKINFYALGHSATEKVGPKALGEHLKEKFKLKVDFIDVPNPF